MKYYLKTCIIRYLLLLLIILSFGACKKGYFYSDINTNSSQLTKPTPNLLLPGIISGTGYVFGGDASRFTTLFMQQTTGAANQSVAYGNYGVGSGDVDNMWTNLYGGSGGVMTNANQLIQVASKYKATNYDAIAKILMANALGLTTDLWGDVPYSQAFLGASNLDPAFDKQQQVYSSIDLLLSQAISELATPDEGAYQPGADDLIYGGTLSSWAAAAHALRAKFFLHLGKVDPNNYKLAITEANAAIAGGFTNFSVPFTGSSSTTQGPWYQFNNQRGDISFTGYMFNIMGTSDPRVAIYSDGGGGLGTLYGNANSPVNLLTTNQLLFIQAEAYFQTGDLANAATAYNAAVADNLKQTVGSSGAAYATSIAKTSSNIELSDIMTQKYIASFLDPEIWTDWRRTGLPAITPNPLGTLNNQIPRSLLYPVSEVINNTSTPQNTTLIKRVWWDK